MFNKKLLTFVVLVSLLLGNLKANLNHTYEFFVAPNLISPSDGATNVAQPVQLQWAGSSGTVAIEIYQGCSESTSIPNSIDLGGYQQVAGPIQVENIFADLSGVTYNPLTNTLFMITNKNAKIFETDLSGGFIRRITLNNFNDPESIAHIDGNTFAITEERLGRVLYISISSNTSSLNLNNMPYTQLPGISNNEGLEGVTYNPDTESYYAVKEKSPRRLFRYNGTSISPNLLPTCEIQANSFGMSDVSDVFHLAMPSGLSNLEVSDKILILSDESNRAVEIDDNCNLYSTLFLPSSGTQHEGITMDNNGTIYVVSEPNMLYIFENPNLDLTPDADVQTGALVFSGTSGGSSFTIPDGILDADTEYCWRVRSGNEWSEMWSFTTGEAEDNDGPGGTTTVTSGISTSSDDAEEASNGNMNLNSTDLELVQETTTQSIGMVFRGLNIPQGANIVEAKLQFTTDETSFQTTNLLIRGEDTNSASGFTSVNNNISNRSKTSAQVSWQVPAWNSIGQSVEGIQGSPDIKSIIQEIVNRNGFGTNSNIGIIITGSGKRVAESFNGGGSSRGPKLTISYNQDCPAAGTVCDDDDPNTENDIADGNCACEGTPIPNCEPQGTTCDDNDDTTYNDAEDGNCNCEGTPCPDGLPCDINGEIIEIRISNGDDDVEENGRNGNMYLNSSDLELVYDRSYTGNQIIGLRFTNIFLPPGATITNAYVQFTTDEVRNLSGNKLIKAESTHDSAPYTNQKYNLSNRLTTHSLVAWTPPSWDIVGESGPKQRTDNIAPLIQELVDRGDWTGLGVAITIVIEGGGRRVAKSYNGSPEDAPLLYIEYENDGQNLVHEPEDKEPENNEERLEISAIQSINLYPNPAAYEVNVDIQMNPTTATQGTITLFDTAGKAHSQSTFAPQTERSVELDVENLAQGIYIVHVQVGEHVATRKFVKK